MYLLNKRLNKLTDHEDLGYDTKGVKNYRCKETGDIRSSGKIQKDIIRAKKEAKKQDNLEFMKNKNTLLPDNQLLSNNNIGKLKNILENE